MIQACSQDPCDCEKNEYCRVCHESSGCSQCIGNNGEYFFKDSNYPCVNCSEIFGDECQFCQNYIGCAQCDNENFIRIYDEIESLYFCQHCQNTFGDNCIFCQDEIGCGQCTNGYTRYQANDTMYYCKENDNNAASNANELTTNDIVVIVTISIIGLICLMILGLFILKMRMNKHKEQATKQENELNKVNEIDMVQINKYARTTQGNKPDGELLEKEDVGGAQTDNFDINDIALSEKVTSDGVGDNVDGNVNNYNKKSEPVMALPETNQGTYNYNGEKNEAMLSLVIQSAKENELQIEGRNESNKNNNRHNDDNDDNDNNESRFTECLGIVLRGLVYGKQYINKNEDKFEQSTLILIQEKLKDISTIITGTDSNIKKANKDKIIQIAISIQHLTNEEKIGQMFVDVVSLMQWNLNERNESFAD